MQRVKRTTAVAVLPAAPAGGTPGFFANPNPSGGIPATVPGYEWFNNVQEEICAIILAAGLALDVNNSAQLLAALRSAGVFQTPAQFDNTTKAATTAFVQRALGNFAGTIILGANPTLTAATAGMHHIAGAGTGTVTMPLVSTLPDGAIFEISAGGAALTVARQGSDQFLAYTGVSGTAQNSLSLGQNETVRIVKYGTSYYVISDTGYASLGTSGYQKLPSGLIIQWGQKTASANLTSQVVTFPITFPLTCASVYVSDASVPGTQTSAWRTAGPTSSGFSYATSAGSGSAQFWLAVGY